MKNKILLISFIILAISGISFYVSNYNKSYNLLLKSIDSKDYDASFKIINSLDKFPIKIKEINDFKAETIISRIDSFPDFNLYKTSTYRRFDDSTEIVRNIKLIEILREGRFLLDEDSSTKLKLDYDVLISSLYLRNINRAFSGRFYFFGDKTKTLSFWDKDGIKYSEIVLEYIYETSDKSVSYETFLLDYTKLNGNNSYKFYYEEEDDYYSSFDIYQGSIDQSIPYEQIINENKLKEVIVDDFYDNIVLDSEQFLNNKYEIFENEYDYDELKKYKPTFHRSTKIHPLFIMAYINPKLDNVKRYTGIDLSKDLLFLGSKEEQDRMVFLIRSFIDYDELKWRSNYNSLSYSGVLKKDERQELMSAFKKYIDTPINENRIPSINSINLLSLIANKYMCAYCDLSDKGFRNNRLTTSYDKELHNELTKKEQKFIINLLSSFTNYNFINESNQNTDLTFRIYGWYLSYLKESKLNTELLKVHNRLVSIEKDKSKLNKFQLGVIAQSHYDVASYKWDKSDWDGAISDYDNAVEYISLIYNSVDTNGNNTTDGSTYYGLSKADIIINRGLAKYNKVINTMFFKQKNWCADLKTAYQLDSSNYDRYLELCIN